MNPSTQHKVYFFSAFQSGNSLPFSRFFSEGSHNNPHVNRGIENNFPEPLNDLQYHATRCLMLSLYGC